MFLDNTYKQHGQTSVPVAGFEEGQLYLGRGQLGLEVLVVESASPAEENRLLRKMSEAYKQRKAGRAAPVLIVVVGPAGVHICGPTGDKPPVISLSDVHQASRLCGNALRLASRHEATRFISAALPSLESGLPGITNEGLLSTRELSWGVRNSPDWGTACIKARAVLTKPDDLCRGMKLIGQLGFKHDRLDNYTDILRANDERTALAILLKENEVPEMGSQRFDGTSPVSYALAKADKEKLPWVVMVKDDALRLYSTSNVGVGRRGRTESFVECQTSLLPEKYIGLLWLLFSAEALKENGTIDGILEQSKRFAESVAKKLRERIYDIVVPELAMGIADARKLKSPDRTQLAETYEMALLVLFRLLFIAYAEDRDLLPYKLNDAYKVRSLKLRAQELSRHALKGLPIDAGPSNYWKEAEVLFDAIAKGNKNIGVPAYNGAMFSAEKKISPIGAKLNGLKLDNQYFEKALRALLLVDSEEGNDMPVDFRALSVREFGTIYEGLLESELSLADQPLSSQSGGVYKPTSNDGKADIQAGQIFLHNRSGARKSTGSFYTPQIIVDYLLDASLDPSIQEHLERLSVMKSDADRADNFFKFRVADISMGSGHFLVSAIDRIERAFALWLQENPVPGVSRELESLRQAAIQKLADCADNITIEDGQLLRRMIARRCIYGVDINPLAVQLARLSIWIHTFVPGLPLSLLDHNLVCGNSVVGVASIEEIREELEKGDDKTPLLNINTRQLLGKAEEPLQRLGTLSDASLDDIEQGRELINEALRNIKGTATLCDLFIGAPVALMNAKEKRRQAKKSNSTSAYQKADAEYVVLKDWASLVFNFEKSNGKNIIKSEQLKLAKEAMKHVNVMHFPIAFPEVFLGDKTGFDIVVGNPPWEKPIVSEDKFWARHYPGLAGLLPPQQDQLTKRLRVERSDLVTLLDVERSKAEQTRTLLRSGNFPGIGTGDPDLYKAFSWRFWFLSDSNSGKIGVVMPRSVLNAKGSEVFRKRLFSNQCSIEVTTLTNNGGWVFDIDPRYSVCLLAISKNPNKNSMSIGLSGPYRSVDSFRQSRNSDTTYFTFDDVLSWNDSASIPMLPLSSSAGVFRQLRKAPRLDLTKPENWRARPDTELHATTQKNLMYLKSGKIPKGLWKVYKGASFDIWNPDTGTYNAWADPDVVLPWLQNRRMKSYKSSRCGAHSEFSIERINDPSTLSVNCPRISFRDVARATDSRTVRCALIPAKTFITHKGPFFVFSSGDKNDEAYLLGVLSSIPFDWYARCFVETSVAFFILSSLTVPRPKRSDPLWKRTVALSGRLACPDERFKDWAESVGVNWGPIDPDRKQKMIFELDAVVAHLYGLSKKQLTHIFETFHEKKVDRERLEGVLGYYEQWKKKSAS